MNNTPKDTLYIIDGFAQIFRSYYAIMGGMNSPVTGEPTAACFGMAGMFIKLFREFNPTHIIMAIDMKGPTFRDEMYPEYKANRDPAPEDLIAQIPRVIEITEKFGIPVIGHSGVEADDVIATLVTKILDNPKYDNVNIKIVSKDKDLHQLLTDRVDMFDIHKDLTMDIPGLKEKVGISPEQVIDYLTLMGDKADNIPGVEGIGPKTASKLLQEYQTIDNLYANIEQIKGKRKEKLIAAQDHLPLSKQLVTLKHDVDFPFSMEDAKVGAINGQEMTELFKTLGFRRHVGDLERLLNPNTVAATAVLPTKKKKDDQPSLFGGSLFDQHDDENPAPASSFTSASDIKTTQINTTSELDKLIKEIQNSKIIAVDTETIGLGHDTKICGICIACDTEQGYYIPTVSPEQDKHLNTQQVVNQLKEVFEDPKIEKTGHNIKYDMMVLRHAGIKMKGVTFDTMIAAFLLQQPGLSMDNLALSLLNHECTSITKLIGPKGKNQITMDRVPLEDITPYAAEDAAISLKLYKDLKPKLTEQKLDKLSEEIEMPLVEVLTEMEFAGIIVNPDVLTEQSTTLNDRIVELREEILALTDCEFNLDSPKQLSNVLFDTLKMPVVKKTKTGRSTDNSVLEKLRDNDSLSDELRLIPTRLIEYRQITKLVNTYLVNLKEAISEKDNRVHASFNQTGAATGRLSSSNPNLQNIPIRTELGKQIRKAFIAPEGHKLICADYSQIELRILAHLSEDENLSQAFIQNKDIHTAVAAQVYQVEESEVTSDMRSHAKTVNFGIIYGISAYGLEKRIDQLDLQQAKTLIANYKNKYPGIDDFMHQCVEDAKNQGYVKTMLGRRRDIPQILSSNGMTRQLGERLAINSVVQGSAADLIKAAMVNIQQKIERDNLPLKMLLQIHDELVFESPDEHAEDMLGLVIAEMECAMSLDVPLRVDGAIGSDWLEAK